MNLFFLKELELIRLARDEAQAQAENEAALKEEERKRREELELLKAEYERLLEEEKNAREIENQVWTEINLYQLYEASGQ